MSTTLLGVIIVGSSVLLAILGLLVERRLHVFQRLGVDNEVLAAVFGMTGTLYAILVAFAIIVVWGDYATTQETASVEANALADTEQMSRGFPVPVRREVREATRTYCRLVIEEEWPLLASGGRSVRADATLMELWQIYTELPEEYTSIGVYSQSLARINELSTNRRLRLLASDKGVPDIMWFLLSVVAVFVVILSYGFRVPKPASHVILSIVLSSVIALSLFLITVLEGPFRGDFKVTPKPFEYVLDSVRSVEP
jgi:hypothetical protein